MVPIILNNLTKQYGSTLAVDAVNLRIEAGELFFLVGPSGCGKTTLLRMIAGLIEPSGGSIHFGDREVTHLPTAKRSTAMVFQGYALWPHLSVAQNVAFGLDVRKVPEAEKRQRVAEALQLVRMSAQADRKPTQLSGGQQQRVALARALVVKPQVLLLDEPLSNLDAKLRAQMREEIRRICTQTRITTVYVTHDQEEALSMADRLAVMRDGRVLQVGSPREVYDRPACRFVADFLGSTNFLPAVVHERDNGQLTLKTVAGPLCSGVFPENLTAGQQVTCSVRPEAVRVLEGPDGADNIFQAHHAGTVYLGHMAQHEVELTDGSRLRINELKPRRIPENCQTVWIGFDAADVVILPD